MERADVMGASGHSFALATVAMLGLWLNLAHKSLLKSVLDVRFYVRSFVSNSVHRRLAPPSLRR